jgi:class 3 adenylate cyclase
MDTTNQTDAPTELRTFLVADIRGYTRFTEHRGDEAAGRLAARFAQLAREAAEAHAGRLLELRGDEALAVFGSARQALRAAVNLQDRCRAATEADSSLPLAIGIGLDAGEAVPVEGGFRGAALNLAARLCGAAAPGEVLAGEGLVYLARKTEGLRFVEQRSMELKGFDEPVRVFRVTPEGGELLPTSAEPPQVEAIQPLRPPIPYRKQTLAQLGQDLGVGTSLSMLGNEIKDQVRRELAGVSREIEAELMARRAQRDQLTRGRAYPARRDRRYLERPRRGRPAAPPTVREVVTALVMLAVIIVIVVLAIHYL